MTRRALADAVGVTPAAVTAWLKPKDADDSASPTQKNLDAIVAALGLTMPEFYGALPKSRRPSKAA